MRTQRSAPSQKNCSLSLIKILFTPLYPPFSGPHLVSLTRQFSPPLPPAAEQWCYLPITSYWSPERGQGAGNQDPQTVLWRKRREGDNRLDDEGNDPLKQLDSCRWALRIATGSIVSLPPLNKIKNNLDLTIRMVSSVADMERKEWERTKGHKGHTVGIICSTKQDSS